MEKQNSVPPNRRLIPIGFLTLLLTFCFMYFSDKPFNGLDLFFIMLGTFLAGAILGSYWWEK